MDPNETLELIRSLIKQIDSAVNQDEMVRSALDLVDYVKILDEWLTCGGFLPDQWVSLIGRSLGFCTDSS